MMLTNLVATIVFTISTNNWRTTHTVHPYVEPSQAALAVYRPVMAHQVAEIRSNTVALVNWKGATNELILESVVIGTANRSIDAFLNGLSP